MNLFKEGSYLNLNSSKKNILFLLYNKNKNKKIEKSYGIYHVLYSKLKEQFNIVIISDVGKPAMNEFIINTDFFKENDIQCVYSQFDKIFNNVEFLYTFNCGEFRLPLGKYTSKYGIDEYYNEFFDYTKESEDLTVINKVIDKIEGNFYRYVPLTAFSTVRSALAFLLNDYFSNISNTVYNVIIDPSFSYTNHFTKKPTLLYFTDDYRGSRKYNKFDIPQFHLVYQNTINNISTNKTKLFMWYGSLFYNKGSKKDIYDIFLKNIEHDIDFYCSLTVNSWKNNKSKDNIENFKKNNFYELYNEIKNNKNYKGYIDNENLVREISKYKYGLITRCISISDSVNFRPVYYTYLDILPFFDYMYDPEYLYIPKHIQDKLVVKSSEDIDRLIDYYENNDGERLELLNELKKMFKFNEYVNDTEKTINTEIKKIIPEYKDTFNYICNINEW